MGDSESLLLVEDDQPKVTEENIRAEKAVGSNDDVDPSLGELFEGLLGLARPDKAGEHSDLHRETGKSPLKGLEVLTDENGRRGEDGHLFAFQDRLERRADGDLGLAVSDIAAEQPVHGALGLHVALDLGDGSILIGGELVLERILELALPG